MEHGFGHTVDLTAMRGRLEGRGKKEGKGMYIFIYIYQLVRNDG